MKIDRRFLTSARESERDRMILRAVPSLGKELRLAPVAEGVEDHETVTLLRDLGTPMKVQGYYFAAPIPASEVPTWRAAM